MLSFGKKPKDDDGDPTITAETKMAMILVQHNTFFNLSVNMTKFINTEFKESPIVQYFSCGRTKTAAIVNCIGDFFFSELLEDSRSDRFCLMLDGSSDNGLEKMYPTTVKIFDINFSREMIKFAHINLITGITASNAASVFESI